MRPRGVDKRLNGSELSLRPPSASSSFELVSPPICCVPVPTTMQMLWPLCTQLC